MARLRLETGLGRLNTLSLGLLSAATAAAVLFAHPSHPVVLVVGVALLGIGFMLAHSTLLTMATECAKAARGTAMSLVAFCFMGGGGIGPAIGVRIIGSYGYTEFYGVYALCLVALLIVARHAVRDSSSTASQPTKPVTVASAEG
jgi:predicted MFS family arabinose efflux permease